jgi:hypothetical protein
LPSKALGAPKKSQIATEMALDERATVLESCASPFTTAPC